MELTPDLGREVAVDATTIVAYANPNRKHTARNPDGPADADASWTKKNSARDPSPQEWFSAIKPMWSPTPTATCRWAWLSLRPVGTIRRFCRRRFRNWRLAIPGSAWRQSRRASPTGDMIPEAITGSSIGTARFRLFTSAGCRTASCMMASTLRRELRPVWAGDGVCPRCSRYRASLVLLPGGRLRPA